MIGVLIKSIGLRLAFHHRDNRRELAAFQSKVGSDAIANHVTRMIIAAPSGVRLSKTRVNMSPRQHLKIITHAAMGSTRNKTVRAMADHIFRLDDTGCDSVSTAPERVCHRSDWLIESKGDIMPSLPACTAHTNDMQRKSK